MEMRQTAHSKKQQSDKEINEDRRVPAFVGGKLLRWDVLSSPQTLLLPGLSPPSPKVKAVDEMPAVAHSIRGWKPLEPLGVVWQHLWVSCVHPCKLAVHLL